MMWDHLVFRRAGLEPKHLLRFIKVSPSVASNWLRGVNQPRGGFMPAMLQLQRAVETALADGLLPVPETLPPTEKSARVIGLLRRLLREAGVELLERDFPALG